MRLEQWKAAQAVVWGSANWRAIADTELFPVHEALIERLGARPGERWLDLATGSGAVALRAARAGAEVTAQDLAPELIETDAVLPTAFAPSTATAGSPTISSSSSPSRMRS